MCTVAEESELDSDFFVSAGVKVLPIWHAADILASSTINAPALFRHESRIWLSAISLRLGGRRSIRHLFHGEISRDIPLTRAILHVGIRLVKATPKYCEPFCLFGKNKLTIKLLSTILNELGNIFFVTCNIYFISRDKTFARNTWLGIHSTPPTADSHSHVTWH